LPFHAKAKEGFGGKTRDMASCRVFPKGVQEPFPMGMAELARNQPLWSGFHTEHGLRCNAFGKEKQERGRSCKRENSAREFHANPTDYAKLAERPDPTWDKRAARFRKMTGKLRLYRKNRPDSCSSLKPFFGGV
jgi:hypothetical protein